MLPYSLVKAYTYPSLGSDAVPPQFTPPIAPGKITAETGGAPGARHAHVVNGPSFVNPPLRSTRSRHALACSSVVSSAVTRSSMRKDILPKGGGFTGIGCVGALNSPGTLLCGTGISLTPNTGCPVSRFK